MSTKDSGNTNHKRNNMTYVFKFDTYRSLTIGYHIVNQNDFYYIYRTITVDSRKTKEMLESYIPDDNPVIGFLRGEKTDISLLNDFVQVLKSIMEKNIVYPENKRPFEITYFQKQVFKQPKMKLSIDNFMDWNSMNSNIKIIKK